MTNGLLDAAIAEDPFVRQLVAHTRQGRGCPLDEAVRYVKEMFEGAPESLERVDDAAERIRDLARQAATMREPGGLIVDDGRQSWYPGPQEQDRYWPALRDLIGEAWGNEDALASLNRASTKILAHTGDPTGNELFNRKGLVLGYVQSGKTTNFTAVVAKAADAGYRLFIVLSGMHDGLRTQTQDRLDEQLRLRFREFWIPLTRGTLEEGQDEHDFVTSAADVEQVVRGGGDGSQKALAVVKKNKFRLEALLRWLDGADPALLESCPVLIIDDEADQAGVNTRRDGETPATINGLIRDLIARLQRVAYIGYTATPFANVLIDPANEGDLYPQDFIIDLPRPEDYVGPEMLFGREPLEFDGDGTIRDDGRNLIREVPEEELGDLKPSGPAQRWDFTPTITPSLERAIRYFLLSTAARRARGEGNRHSTMLVHTAQWTSVHAQMAAEITSHLDQIRGGLDERRPGLLNELEEQWREECTLAPAEEFGVDAVPWEEVSARLAAAAADARVIQDNSMSTDRLHYPTDPSSPPVTVIAVGGNTLSRGLTLEGLSVSFFVRSASAYDTLLQMGRWFGYRRGYADLTRVWMTEEMREWFRHLATVEQEIRYDVERYEAEHLTPRDLGPRIRTHPQMAITAAAKMRTADWANVSYSARRLQTILFEHRDADWLEANSGAARELVQAVRADRAAIDVRPGIRVFRNVPAEHVIRFINDYQFHENSRDLNAAAILEYIDRRHEEDELRHWSIAVMALPQERAELGSLDLGLDAPVACINRARLNHPGRSYADIKALMSRSDRVVDLDLPTAEVGDMSPEQLARARNAPSEGRGDNTGLVALYPISKDSVPDRGEARVPLGAEAHVVGVGLVFPRSSSEENSAVEYRTADLSRVSREEPDEADEPDEEEQDAA